MTGHIADFKIPKLFVPIEATDWPLLANNKVDKLTLSKRAEALYGSMPVPPGRR